MAFLAGNNWDPDVNSLHYRPGDFTKPSVTDPFGHPQGEMESYQVPGNYRIVRPDSREDRQIENTSQDRALTTIRNNLGSLEEGGFRNTEARRLGIIGPDETLIDEFAEEIALDSRATKTGTLQEGVDALQTGMYAISGGLLSMMKTGDIADSFKQSLSEIRHTFDDDYSGPQLMVQPRSVPSGVGSDLTRQ